MSRAGRLSRSLILALALAAALLAAAAAAPAAGAKAKPFRFGLNDLPLVHGANASRALALHARLGATVIRVGLAWRSIEPKPGRYDWSYEDRIYNAARSKGMAPILLLGSVPAWAAKHTYVRQCSPNPDAQACQRPPAPEHLGDLRRLVATAARRYPKLAAIEVFNEPNLGNYNFQPEADPEYYVQVLRAVRDAVKGARPSLPVISGGLTYPPYPVLKGMMGPDEFLRRMYEAGARGAMDGIGVHPYPSDDAPGNTHGPGYRLLDTVRTLRGRFGDSKRHLWTTETGYTTRGSFAIGLDLQRSWLPDLVRRLFRQPDMESVVVHTLTDKTGDQPEDGYGLLLTNFVEKPVFGALRTAVARIKEERTAAACRCTKRARRCISRHSRTRNCKRAAKRCRCIRRWRSCVRRGSHSRACRKARRCARCRPVTAAGARCTAWRG